MTRLNHCVEATAGSGKTTRMVQELGTLLTTQSPSACLAITFTEKAAHEMRHRLYHHLREGGTRSPNALIDRMAIETIHSFCLRLLKTYGLLIHLSPQMRIVSGVPLTLRVRDHCRRLWQDHAASPPPWLTTCLSTWSMDQWATMLLTAYTNRDSVGYWLAEGLVHADIRDPDYTDAYATIGNAFRHSFNALMARIDADKRQGHWLDYDDVLSKTYQLLMNVDWLRHDLQTQYTHIFVDEFQDTSPIQWAIVSALCNDADPFDSGKLWIVGDRCQAIYGFRGADDALMRMVCTTDHPQLVQIKQTANYRSHPVIVAFINTLFTRLFADQEADFLTMTPHHTPHDTASIRCHLHDDLNDELSAIATYIHQCPATVNRSDIAILVRKNSDAQTIKGFLTEQGIPVQIPTGAGLCKLDSVQIIRNWIKGLLDPSDTLVWYGIAVDILGLSDTDFESALRADTPIGAYFRDRDDRVRDGMIALHSGDYITQLRHQIYQLPLPFSPMDQHAVDQFLTAFSAHWTAVSGDRPSVLDWLDACLADPNSLRIDNDTQGDAVHIMTLHAAKGLEFPVVIVPFLHAPFSNDALQPLIVSREWGLGFRVPQWTKNPIRSALSDQLKPAAILEELRLFYVTLTRAKYHLYLSGKRLTRKQACRLMLLLPHITDTPSQVVFNWDMPIAEPAPHVPPSKRLPIPPSPLMAATVPTYTPPLSLTITDVLTAYKCPKRMYLQRYRPQHIRPTDDQQAGTQMHQRVIRAILTKQRTPTPDDPDWLARIIQSDWYITLLARPHSRVEYPFWYTYNQFRITGRIDIGWLDPETRTMGLIELKRSLDHSLDRYSHQLHLYGEVATPSGYTFDPTASFLVDCTHNRVVPLAQNPQPLTAILDALAQPHTRPDHCPFCPFADYVTACSTSTWA